MAYLSPQPQSESQAMRQAQEPLNIQLDPKCLHSSLKEFFDPLKANSPRTDFTVCHKESGEFGRDYAGKYGKEMSLILASLFSTVTPASIIDGQSKLEPDPNETTAAYMGTPTHAMSNSPCLDANPSSTTWNGPPFEFVVVQSLLYISAVISFSVVSLAMLEKRRINRYIRNRRHPPVNKSRDRQQKLDGLGGRYFRLAIKSLPVMLQLALLLLGFALSLYLWTTSRTSVQVAPAFTLFAVVSYVLLTLTVMVYYNCPHRTPRSIAARTHTRRLTQSCSTFARSIRSLTTPTAGAHILSVEDLKRILRQLRAGIYSTLSSFGCILGVLDEEKHIPLAVAGLPPWLKDIPIDRGGGVCKADAHCISWILHSTADTDVVFSTARFVVDTIRCPKIAQARSPRTLADGTGINP